MPHPATRWVFAAALIASGLGGCKPRSAAVDAKQALADLPPRFQAADLKNGEELFTQCRSCHTAISGGANMTGPNLHGVFGRKPGTQPGFDYSDALKVYVARGAPAWNAELIDRWLADPKGFMPGTKMSFPGYPDADNRRDVVAYLKVVSSAP